MCVRACVCMFIRELGGSGLFGESQSKQVRVMLGASLGSALMEFNPDLSSPRSSPCPIIVGVCLCVCVFENWGENTV